MSGAALSPAAGTAPAGASSAAARKPALGFWQIFNMSFGFFGIQIAFGLQNANASRIFQTLGANVDELALFWIAGPVTGLLVQPLVGYFSDRTWTRLGRRRPFFLAGAMVAGFALFVMPGSAALWMAVLMLWLLDASINISMEPFRAFVGDLLPSSQRTRGFAMQTIFIGTGAFLASIAPWVMTELFGVANTAPPGEVPDSVRYSFYIGGAALVAAIGWTVISTGEYSPEEMARFDAGKGESGVDIAIEAARRTAPGSGFFVRWGLIFAALGGAGIVAVASTGADRQFYILCGALAALGLLYLVNAVLKRGGETHNMLSEILDDLTTMPATMRQLALVQFFSWSALFVMWIYSTPAVAAWHFGSDDPASAAFNEAGNWVGWMFAVYNLVAAIYAFLIPAVVRAIGPRATHAANLLAGAAGLAGYMLIRDPDWLMLSMLGVGVAWASILTMPYAILSDALPSTKMGIYMGIFNFFIVLPQLMVAGVMGPVLREFLGGQAINVLPLGALSFAIAAGSMMLVEVKRAAPE